MRRAALIATLFLAACEARAPSPTESRALSFVKRRITVGGKADENPLPDTASVVRSGEAAFSHYCTVCHGLDGRATGVPFAAAMSPPVPSLGSPEVQAYTDGQLHRIIVGGLSPSGMPASREILNDEEVWSIVRFLRHLPAAGSRGEPAIYGGGPSPR